MAKTGIEDAITYVFRWRTSHDVKVCQKCRSLEGQILFHNLFAPVLVSDTHGPVWDLDRDHSLAHGYHRYNCRCTLEVEVEVDWNRMVELEILCARLNAQGVKFKFIVERFRLSSSISVARQQMTNFLNTIGKLGAETRETNNALAIYLALARRSGNENVNQLISLFQRGRITAEMFIRSIQTLYAASGPWGWLIGGGQLALGGLMFAGEFGAIGLGSQSVREEQGSEGPQ
jgi:hypothetical protein